MTCQSGSARPNASGLRISACLKCRRSYWPPNRYCPGCLAKTKLRSISARGQIIEYSGNVDGRFCVAEFEGGIRLFCALDCVGEPNTGQEVTLERVEESGRSFKFFCRSSSDMQRQI